MAVPLLRLLRDGVVHQDPPHRLRRNGEEMGAVLPAQPIQPEQLNVSLVHQAGRVQRVVPPLPAALSPGDALELLIEDRKQPIDRGSAVMKNASSSPSGRSTRLSCFASRSAEGRSRKSKISQQRMPSMVSDS